MKISGYERAYNLLDVIWDVWTPESRQWFLEQDTITLHSSLGRMLRDGVGLWEDDWEPYMLTTSTGVEHDHSHNHPDAISARVMKTFQQNKILERS